MKSLLFVIFAVNIIFSQTDTLLEAIKYYPLQTGNYWEYVNYYWEIPYYKDSSFYSIEITGDTLLSNNKVYKILTSKSIPYNGHIGKRYERIDSSTACVYRYAADTIFINNEYLVDSLLAQPGDYFAGSYKWNGLYAGDFSTLCLNIYDDTVLAYPTEIRELEDQSTIPEISLSFAKGLGYINSLVCEFSCGAVDLRYAKIDGVEFGTQITGMQSRNSQQLTEYVLYQNYPNPFNPTTNIRFSIPHPGFVSLKVYDILGKEVAILVNEVNPAGRYDIKFDGSNVSSGIYFYVLRSGDFVQSRKMLLLK
jgi:Secretion system C-terminal sorting domain